MAVLGGIQVVSWLFSFDDDIQAFVQREPVLAIMVLLAFGLYSYIFWDADRFRKKREYEDRLEGASRRRGGRKRG
jgi:hypothetical protein